LTDASHTLETLVGDRMRVQQPCLSRSRSKKDRFTMQNHVNRSKNGLEEQPKLILVDFEG
jgi:hypothetical protein